MGISRWCYTVYLCIILCLCLIKYSSTQHTLCNLTGCNCTNPGSNWKYVNCSFGGDQNLELTSSLIPTNVEELFISGSNNMVIPPEAFKSLSRLALVRIDGPKNVILKKLSFFNNSSPSLLVQIQNCEQLVIETMAFWNMQSSLEAEISRINTVSIQKSAFSRLVSGKFKDISTLKLAEDTFQFKDQRYINRHGPVTTLSFHSVVIPKIPRATFISALQEVSIHNSEIMDIHSEAFSSNQISTVRIENTSIHRIRSNAFKEGTLIYNFILINCNISVFETNALVGAVTNLTVQLSRITDIQQGAINVTVANAVITDNEIEHFRTYAFSLKNWNTVSVNHNIIKYLYTTFLEAPVNPDIHHFAFTGNEIYHLADGALSCIPAVQRVLKFDDNFFNQTCHCGLNKWLESLLVSKNVQFAMNSTFCLVTGLLSRCFSLEMGLINMQNFTELVCKAGDTIVCEPYEGETKVIDTTSKMLFDDKEDNNSNLILGLTLGALFIVAVSGTIVILLIRGGLWLKRKGYFRNMRYNQNETSNDDENTIVTVDRSDDKPDLPEELTPELLQTLRERLEDPLTHQEACEMIERLYDMFIVDESYANNNREEEAHLYEELGNLQAPQVAEQENNKLESRNTPTSFLRLMEEKFNFPLIDEEPTNETPTLVGEYSEPSDAVIHLYSELMRQNKESSDIGKNDTVKSNGSSNMAFRPLPKKPALSEAGPSSKY